MNDNHRLTAVDDSCDSFASGELAGMTMATDHASASGERCAPVTGKAASHRADAGFDLPGFLTATDLAVLMVDADLHLRNFTQAAQRIFLLGTADHGRPLRDIATVFGGAALHDIAAQVAATGTAQSVHLTEAAADWAWRLEARPHLDSAGTVRGAVLLLHDMTPITSLARDIKNQQDRLQTLHRLTRMSVWELCCITEMVDLDDRANVLGVGHSLRLPLGAFLDLVAAEDRDGFAAALERCAEDGADIALTLRPSAARLRDRRLGTVATRSTDASGAQRLTGGLTDVTDSHNAAELRETLLREMEHRVKNLFTQIAAMVRISARTAEDTEDMAADICARIRALADSHALAIEARAGQQMDVDALLRRTLAAYAGREIRLQTQSPH